MRHHTRTGRKQGIATCSAACLLVTLLAPLAVSALSDIPRDETWATNGSVYAIARSVDTVYIGGEFTPFPIQHRYVR